MIEDQYRRGDSVVGKALGYVDDETLLIVLSDHGFGSFQRGVLPQHLAARSGVARTAGRESAGEGHRRPAHGDRLDPHEGLRAWPRGHLTWNLKGREGQGIVPPDEAENLKSSIARGLSGLVDPARGAEAIRGVRPREEVYSGPYSTEAPDLLVRFAGGYRASWATATGGVPEGQFEDNIKKWSGDHIIDPELVPGILLMNRPFRGEAASLVDLAPTISSEEPCSARAKDPPWKGRACSP